MDGRRGHAPRLDCGWTFDAKKRSAALEKAQKWIPKGEKDKRDKDICVLILAHDLNSAQIERLHHNRFVRWTRNGKTSEPLTSRGIRSIFYKHFPELRRNRGYSATTENTKRRYEFYTSREHLLNGRPKVCAFCGSDDDLRVHHIIPICDGGENTPYNLMYLCEDCHRAIHALIYPNFIINRRA